MSRGKLLFVLLLLIFAVVALQVAAIAFSLYWSVWWFDLLIHFLGGAFAALFALWLCFYSGYISGHILARFLPMHAVILLLALGGALSLGIGWEVFESFIGQTWSPEGYWIDTISDIAADLAGAFVCAAVFWRMKRKEAGFQRSISYEEQT